MKNLGIEIAEMENKNYDSGHRGSTGSRAMFIKRKFEEFNRKNRTEMALCGTAHILQEQHQRNSKESGRNLKWMFKNSHKYFKSDNNN